MSENLAYAVQGDFENPGGGIDEVVILAIGEPQFNSYGNMIDLVYFEELSQWQVTYNGGPIATKDGPARPDGVYTNQFLVGRMCDLVLEASDKPRRSSLQLSHDEQDRLELIAFHVGATHRGKGSYRTMLRQILSGQLRVEKVNKNLLFGKVKGL